MARIQQVVAPATPKRGRKKKAVREKRPDNQWQLNLKSWNRRNSGWCIPRKGSDDYYKVKYLHEERTPKAATPDMESYIGGLDHPEEGFSPVTEAQARRLSFGGEETRQDIISLEREIAAKRREAEAVEARARASKIRSRIPIYLPRR